MGKRILRYYLNDDVETRRGVDILLALLIIKQSSMYLVGRIRDNNEVEATLENYIHSWLWWDWVEDNCMPLGRQIRVRLSPQMVCDQNCQSSFYRQRISIWLAEFSCSSCLTAESSTRRLWPTSSQMSTFNL